MAVKLNGNCIINFILLCAVCMIGPYAELCEFHSMSPTCQRFHQIQVTLDDTVDPCEDFYGYACNNWRVAHSDLHYQNTVDMLDYQMNLKLIRVLDSVDPQTLPLNILNETCKYYKSCLNARKSNNLRAYLALIKPGQQLEWPILQELEAYENGKTNFSIDEWPAAYFDHFILLGQLMNYGLNGIILFIDMFRTPSGMLYFSAKAPPGFDFITEPEVPDLLTELGLTAEMALDYSKRLKETHNYWQRQRQQFNTSSNQFIPSYEELKSKFPYFQKILANLQIHHFNDNDDIRLQDIEYLQFLLEKQLSSVEKRDLCNYIMLRFLIYLQQNAVKPLTKLDCITELREKLDLPVDLLYYEYIYRPEELYSNADVQMLFQKTRDYLYLALAEQLVGYDPILQELKVELNRMPLNMGNMPRSMFASYFDILYGNLPPMQANNYYSNQLNLLKHGNFLKLKYLNRTHYIGNANRYGWMPFYDYHSGTVILPLVTLQPPFYHHTFDPIFKWSIMGYFFAQGFLTNGLVTPLTNYHDLNVTFNVDVALRAYVNDQKSKLQPDFTNMPWKKIFLLNLAQFYCSTNGSATPTRQSNFVRSFASQLEGFTEAFQCNISREEKN